MSVTDMVIKHYISVIAMRLHHRRIHSSCANQYISPLFYKMLSPF